MLLSVHIVTNVQYKVLHFVTNADIHCVTNVLSFYL